ncbi:RHS repeat protein, partial [bacterium]|nr:RHS repeat protein [bacterium]
YYDTNAASSHRRNKLESIQITPAPTDNDTGYQDSDSSTQTYTYTYDDKGDELTVAYQEGNYLMEVAFTRDDYGRITGKTSNGSVPVSQTFTYNSRNLLETATDTVGNATATSVTRLYDSFGNPYSESVSSGNVTKTVSRRMTDAKTYQFTYPDGKTLRKTATGNDLDSIEYGTTGNLAELASYSRANGVLTAVTKGQNLIETFSYNNWNMLDNHTVSNANTDVYDMTYGYSRGWHLIEKADGIRNTSDKYSYDSYYRLKEVKYDFANNTAARTDNFYQDGVHNIEQSTENGTTFAWGVDKLNRLRDKKVGGNTAVTYKYDKRNNMIGEDFDGSEPADISYIYDDLNRLIEVKDGSNQTIATYTYDAFNRRITKTVGSTTERYSYDDWDIVEISTNSNDYANIIDSGTDRHIAIEVTANNVSTLYYFLTDERSNVTALTDGNGNVLERYRYRVYGDFEILDAQFLPKNCNNQTCYATNLHNFLWGGSLYEPETNLYWMRNRYYHLDMHRFINQDPIGIWGDANNLGNGFAYVAGMVIEASDPSGLETEIIYWLPVLDGKREHWTSIAGHISVRIDDTSYSWDGNGINIDSIENYLGKNNYRTGEGMILNISAEVEQELENYLKNLPHEDNVYNFVDNNCGQVVLRGLGEILDKYVSIASPKEAKEWLIKEELVKAIKKYYAGKSDGLSEKFLNQLIDAILKIIRLINPDFFDGEHKGNVETEDASCSGTGKGCNGKDNSDGDYPLDPDETVDKFQIIFLNNILKYKLRLLQEEQPPFFIDNSTGPNGAIMIYKNPYYVNKDPLKTIFFEGNDGSGRPMIYRNPFAPGAEYGYDSTTYEKFQQKGFIQPEVDPWLR